jgi:hypothetical protein
LHYYKSYGIIIYVKRLREQRKKRKDKKIMNYYTIFMKLKNTTTLQEWVYYVSAGEDIFSFAEDKAPMKVMEAENIEAMEKIVEGFKDEIEGLLEDVGADIATVKVFNLEKGSVKGTINFYWVKSMEQGEWY